jgi:hypothetical protein
VIAKIRRYSEERASSLGSHVLDSEVMTRVLRLAVLATVASICVGDESGVPTGPAPQHRTHLTCCVVSAPTTPVVPDIRGTTQQPLILAPIPKSEEQKTDENTERDWRHTMDRQTLILSLATALVLALQFFAFIYQALLLRRSIRSAERTTRRQLRAYVHIDIAGAALKVADGVAKATLMLRNFGQTPAYDLWVTGGSAIAPVFAEAPVGRTSAGALGPGATFTLTTRLQVNNDMLATLQAGDLTLFLHGTVSYRDTFGDEQEMTFRVMTAGRTRHGEWDELIYAPEGNNTT